MTGRRDKVEQRVHPLILEPRVPSDPRLFGEDVVVLQFEVGQDLLKAIEWINIRVSSRLRGGHETQKEGDSPVFVVNVVSESFGVDQGHGDPHAVLFQLYSPK